MGSAWDMRKSYLRKVGVAKSRRQRSTPDKGPLSQRACLGGPCECPQRVSRHDRKQAVSSWPPTPGETSTTCLCFGASGQASLEPVWPLKRLRLAQSVRDIQHHPKRRQRRWGRERQALVSGRPQQGGRSGSESSPLPKTKAVAMTTAFRRLSSAAWTV